MPSVMPVQTADAAETADDEWNIHKSNYAYIDSKNIEVH